MDDPLDEALTIYEGLAERFLSIKALDENHIILGEPTNVDPPSIYTGFGRLDSDIAGQKTVIHYYFVHRLLVRWQDFPEAERELLRWIKRIIQAINDDPKLNKRIPDGMTKIISGDSGFPTISNVKYRSIDFISDTLVKSPYQTRS
jgi:hypothetical protein